MPRSNLTYAQRVAAKEKQSAKDKLTRAAKQKAAAPKAGKDKATKTNILFHRSADNKSFVLHLKKLLTLATGNKNLSLVERDGRFGIVGLTDAEMKNKNALIKKATLMQRADYQKDRKAKIATNEKDLRAKKKTARAIIADLKEKGIKAKVVVDSKTGKTTIEIAVAETAE